MVVTDAMVVKIISHIMGTFLILHPIKGELPRITSLLTKSAVSMVSGIRVEVHAEGMPRVEYVRPSKHGGKWSLAPLRRIFFISIAKSAKRSNLVPGIFQGLGKATIL